MTDPARAALPQIATLHTDGWGGRQRQTVVVIAETPKRYRIRAFQSGEIRVPAGRHGILKIFGNGTHLVPKTAITFDERVEESIHV